MDVWCFRCRNDHGFSHVPDDEQIPEQGCRLLLRSMTEKGPFDWLREDQDYTTQGGWDPAKLVCEMFDRCPCQDDPGWEPDPPAPFNPDQGLLFDMLPDSPVTPGGMVVQVRVSEREGAVS